MSRAWYAAAGRPVLHQRTGFTEWLPTGAGVLAFSTIEEGVAAVEEVERDYAQHSHAARAIAEEHFEARRVLAAMLDSGGLR